MMTSTPTTSSNVQQPAVRGGARSASRNPLAPRATHRSCEDVAEATLQAGDVTAALTMIRVVGALMTPIDARPRFAAEAGFYWLSLQYRLRPKTRADAQNLTDDHIAIFNALSVAWKAESLAIPAVRSEDRQETWTAFRRYMAGLRVRKAWELIRAPLAARAAADQARHAARPRGGRLHSLSGGATPAAALAEAGFPRVAQRTLMGLPHDQPTPFDGPRGTSDDATISALKALFPVRDGEWDDMTAHVLFHRARCAARDALMANENAAVEDAAESGLGRPPRDVRLTTPERLLTHAGHTRALTGAGIDGIDGSVVLMLHRRQPEILGQILKLTRDTLMDDDETNTGGAARRRLCAIALGSRLRALEKPGGGIRPIVIAPLFVRTVTRAAVVEERDSIRALFRRSNQYVYSGCPEPISLAMRAIAAHKELDVPWVSVLWDGRNAFNSASQEVMCRAALKLAAGAPLTSLAALSSSCSNHRQPMVVSGTARALTADAGAMAASARTVRPANVGTAQGSPESPALFAAAMCVIRTKVEQRAMYREHTDLQGSAVDPASWTPTPTGMEHVRGRVLQLVRDAQYASGLPLGVPDGGAWHAAFDEAWKRTMKATPRPGTQDLLYADDVNVVANPISALAYTCALIAEAEDAGIETNSSKSIAITPAVDGDMVNSLFAPLRGDGSGAAATAATAPRWGVHEHGRYLGVTLGDPESPLVRSVVTDEITSSITSPILRLCSELRAGACPATQRFMLATYILPRIEMVAGAWGATLGSSAFQAVDIALDDFCALVCPASRLVPYAAGANPPRPTPTGSRTVSDRLLGLGAEPEVLSDRERIRAELALHGADGGLGIPVVRALAFCRAARHFPHKVASSHDLPNSALPYFKDVWGPNPRETDVAPDHAYDTWLGCVRAAVDHTVDTMAEAPTSRLDARYHKRRLECNRLPGGTFAIKSVPWSPVLTVDAEMWADATTLMFGSRKAAKDLSDTMAKGAKDRGPLAEEVLARALRRLIRSPDVRVRTQPAPDRQIPDDVAAAPLPAHPAAVPPSGARAPWTQTNTAPLRADGRRGVRADVQVASTFCGSLATIDIGVYDPLRHDGTAVTKTLSDAALVKREKYSGRYNGLFVPLICTPLGAIADETRRALIRVAAAVVAPAPHRADAARRLTMGAKLELHHELAVGLLRVFSRLARGLRPEVGGCGESQAPDPGEHSRGSRSAGAVGAPTPERQAGGGRVARAAPAVPGPGTPWRREAVARSVVPVGGRRGSPRGGDAVALAGQRHGRPARPAAARGTGELCDTPSAVPVPPRRDGTRASIAGRSASGPAACRGHGTMQVLAPAVTWAGRSAVRGNGPPRGASMDRPPATPRPTTALVMATTAGRAGGAGENEVLAGEGAPRCVTKVAERPGSSNAILTQSPPELCSTYSGTVARSVMSRRRVRSAAGAGPGVPARAARTEGEGRRGPSHPIEADSVPAAALLAPASGCESDDSPYVITDIDDDVGPVATGRSRRDHDGGAR